MKIKQPPPDHLVPLSWLEKNGVGQEEVDNWSKLGLVVKTVIHGGAQFVPFRAIISQLSSKK